jgi:MerR family transcriptional regulator, redox-sensitive transcriptional activator SoxR
MLLTIGEVAARAGLSVSAIRYYEARGLVPKAPRRGGKRVYDGSVLDRLAVIELAKAAGLSLTEIHDVVANTSRDGPRVVWRHITRTKREAVETEILRLARIRELLSALSACGCESLDACGRAFASARAAGSTQGLESTRSSRLPQRRKPDQGR